MILLGLVGKFGGLFASLPPPLISGLFCIVFGMIAAVGLAMLAHTDQRSDRNVRENGLGRQPGRDVSGRLQGRGLCKN